MLIAWLSATQAMPDLGLSEFPDPRAGQGCHSQRRAHTALRAVE